MFLPASKQKRCPHFEHLWLVKVKVTLQSFLLHLLRSVYFKKCLCNFLKWWCSLSIVSLSFSSTKVDNVSCNLMMSMSSLLISNKKFLSCKWLTTSNNFWCRQELKIGISGALFEEKGFSFDNLTHAVFWTKGVNLLIKVQ